MDWNATFTAKIAGRTALVQLGDLKNIILWQVSGAKGEAFVTAHESDPEAGRLVAAADEPFTSRSAVPPSLLNVIEDPDVTKLGVQIGGRSRARLQSFLVAHATRPSLNSPVASTAGDGAKFARDFSTPEKRVVPRGLLELSDMAKYVNPEAYKSVRHIIGLQQLVADFLEKYLVSSPRWSERTRHALRGRSGTSLTGSPYAFHGLYRKRATPEHPFGRRD